MKREHICISCMRNKGEEEVCPYCGFDHRTYRREQNHIPPGTVLNSEYLIGAVQGQGSIGITYKAYDLRKQETVIVKELFLREICVREENLRVSVPMEYRQSFIEYRRNFLEEARRLTEFDEERGSIVDGRDFFERNNTVYLVMEYVRGETLEEYIRRRKRMSLKESLRVLWPVFSSVSELHSGKMVHKAVRPDNILVRKSGLKLLDPGGAVLIDDMDRSHPMSMREGYTPPEQYRTAGRVGPWTDVYGAAATLYYCVTGRHPVGDGESKGKSEIVFDEEFQRRFRNADKVLRIALQQNHVKRYQSMKEFLEELEEFHRQGSGRRFLIPVTVAAAGLAAIIGGTAVFSDRRAEPPVFYEMTDGIYMIRNMGDRSQCLGIEEGYPDDGTRVRAMNPGDHNYTRFRIEQEERMETAEAEGTYSFCEIRVCHTDSGLSFGNYDEETVLLQDSEASGRFRVEILSQSESGDNIVMIYTEEGLALCLDRRLADLAVTAAEPNENDVSQQWMLTETAQNTEEEKIPVQNPGDVVTGMEGKYLISDNREFSEFLSAKTNISGEYPIVALSSDIRADSPYWTITEQETEGTYTLRADPERVGEAGYLELIPGSRALALNVENHSENQIFKIIYGGKGSYLLQTADEGYMVRKPEALTLDQSGVGSDFFQDADTEAIRWYIVRNASTNN